MTAVWARARSELRAGWRAWVALALLLGMCGGAVTAAAAGARRTTSAFPRLLEATDSFDVLVNPDDGDMDFDAVERLPQVARTARGAGVAVLPTGPDGRVDLNFGRFFNFVASLDGELAYTMERPKILEGRMPRPDRADEVLLDEGSASREKLRVGSTLSVFSFSRDEAMAFEAGGGEPPSGTQVRSTVALQATVLVAVALAVGLPLGVAAGRWAWSLLAEQLGAVPEPVIPVIPLLAMVPVSLVVANLVAALPARLAARTQPASVLRAE